MSVQSINPATGEVLETIEETSKTQIEQALAQAHAAFLEWRTRPFADRARLMRAAAKELRANKAEYALTMTREMGKPITQAEAEVEKSAGTCDYYAEHAEAFLAEQPRETDATRELRPLRSARGGAGRDAVELPVLAGLPRSRRRPSWRATAASSSTPPTFRAARWQIEQVFRRAGFPDGLFRTAARRTRRGEGDHRGPAYRGGDAHRQRARGQWRSPSRPGAC